MQYLLNWDKQIFLWLNQWAGQANFTDGLIRFLAQDFPYVVAIGFIVVWLWRANARRMLLQGVLALLLGRVILVEIIRQVLPRSRPFEVLHVVQLISKGMEKSFPSGHATALFAVAVSVYFYHKKWGAGLLIICFISVLARVIAGVHYLSDILAGVALGWFSAWVVKNYATKVVEILLGLWQKMNFWQK